MTTPIPFSKAFQIGGYDDRPIMTLASPQLPIKNPYMRKTSQKVQSYGLPDGVNKTTLGAYRMGDSETSSGAIYSDTNHAPIPPMERKTSAVQFAQVGNNVYQPGLNDNALHALLKKFGDQKFKAAENDKYARYFQEERLKKDIQRAERTAGVEELSMAREIIRNVVAERRQNNEQDYLRRLLDAGFSADDAQDELDNVRRAAALQEARNPDNRSYQSKLLLTRLANKRGLLSKVNEPITSAAIMNPQPNQQIASALGTPEIGFGSSPLDLAYQFKTPEYYRRVLRRSNLTQESADRETALNNLIAEGADQTETFYPEILRGRERQKALEQERIAAAQRLQLSRRSGKMIVEPIEKPQFAAESVNKILEFLDLKPGDNVRFKNADVFDLSLKDLLLAANTIIYQDPGKLAELKKSFAGSSLVSKDLRSELATRLFEINGNNIEVSLPVLEATPNIVSASKVQKDILAFVSEPSEMTVQRQNEIKAQITKRNTTRRKPRNVSQPMKAIMPPPEVKTSSAPIIGSSGKVYIDVTPGSSSRMVSYDDPDILAIRTLNRKTISKRLRDMKVDFSESDSLSSLREKLTNAVLRQKSKAD